VVPVVARGVIIRRPALVAVSEKIDADRRLVRTLQRLRRRYGRSPLRLRVPGRSLVLVLSLEDVQRVLEGSPEPFATSTPEKRGALGTFQPHGVLISHGTDRADRRRFNEAVLDTARPLHRLAAPMTTIVRQEMTSLIESATASGALDWNTFNGAWARLVRRVVLGDGARDDRELTDLLVRLRSEANWSLFHSGHTGLREDFLRRLRDRLDRAEPGSLAAAMAEIPTTPRTHPVEQVPQWLFAFEPAGMAAFRALALLATHDEESRLVRDELSGQDLSVPAQLPRLRAAVLESVRLWPTTPAILRETTTTAELGGRTLAAGSLVVVLSSFFHRDDETLPYADHFAPWVWRDGTARAGWSLVPFSAGPAVCAGQNLVLFLTSSLLAAVLERHDVHLASGPELRPERPLPGTLNPFGLRFTVTPRVDRQLRVDAGEAST